MNFFSLFHNRATEMRVNGKQKLSIIFRDQTVCPVCRAADKLKETYPRALLSFFHFDHLTNGDLFHVIGNLSITESIFI